MKHTIRLRPPETETCITNNLREQMPAFFHYPLLGSIAFMAAMTALTYATTTSTVPFDRFVRQLCLAAFCGGTLVVGFMIYDEVRPVSTQGVCGIAVLASTGVFVWIWNAGKLLRAGR
jgi:hypothetical protein